MQKRIKNLAKRWLSAFVDYKIFIRFLNLPRYFLQYFKYKKLSAGEKLNFYDSFPCLTDSLSRTPFDAHYFYQAAWLARQLADQGCEQHVDVGSDVRMINVLSAFVDIEFIDHRPLDVSLPGLQCNAGNIVALDKDEKSIQSLSSLHVIEHVGLGRYGDALDPDGSKKALLELQRILAKSGRLYISIPVGVERVCFNAHRVFNPQTIVEWLSELELIEFSLVDDNSIFHQDVSTDMADNQDYACGMFVFNRK
jgi:hypothetical protein